MRLSLAALILAPAALAQSSASASASASGAAGNSSSAGSAYLTQVLGALNAANLTGLVGVASAIANTTAGMALLSSLATGNHTVFAPNNAAFANVSSDVTSNTTLLTQILSYHITNNTFTANNTANYPNHTIARTLYNGGMLPGNRTSPLVLSNINGTNGSILTVLQSNNVSAMGPAVAANLNVYIINQVLTLPQNISTVAASLFPSLAGVIQQSGLLAPLASAVGITVFAPNDAAIAGVQSALGTLNTTQIQTVLANHVINGTVAYSTNLGSGNYTSAAGEPFMFMSNTSGTYVTSGNSTARILRSDIIINNGVVHTIDGVLVNTNSNATAAAGAYSSAVAGATSTDNASPATSTPASSSSSTSKAAAGQAAPFAWNSLIGAGVAAAGVVLGGGYVLA